MNTGIPYGGGSPHGSNPTSNIRFPISTAPVDSNISSTIAASVSVLASNCQSESRPGSFPSNGVPTLALGSVMKPSSDIEMYDVTLLMTAPPHRIDLFRRLPDTKWLRSNRSASASLLPENIQSWTLAPALSPSGCSVLTLRPATNPSRDMDISR